MPASRLRWFWTTPLGAPVEPDVYLRHAGEFAAPPTCWSPWQGAGALIDVERGQAGVGICLREIGGITQHQAGAGICEYEIVSIGRKSRVQEDVGLADFNTPKIATIA